MGEGTVENLGAVEREKVDVEGGGNGLLLNGGDYGVAMLEHEGADRKDERSKMGGPCSGKKIFVFETLDFCEFEELADTEEKFVKGFVDTSTVRGEI